MSAYTLAFLLALRRSSRWSSQMAIRAHVSWMPQRTRGPLLFLAADVCAACATSLSFLRSSSRRALSCSISRVSVSTVSGAWWSTFIVVPSVAIFGVPGADGRRKR
uniref:Uncharacterized protein n=1 Tax=Ixodes ricinus TaxID=34613 RepID=A0A6B0UDM4_IXORI